MEEAIQSASARVKAIAPLVDASGRKLIADSLTDANANPWQTMASLQSQLSYNHPTSDGAVQLLLAMDSDLSSISVSIFESLSSQLESMIGKLNQEALEDLLRETIKYIQIKELKPVPISIMKKMSVIPANYLQALIANSTLSEFPIDVRRQAWQTENGRLHYIKAIDDVLQESGGDQANTSNGNIAALEAKRLEIHAKSVSDMIMTSKPLFEAFADHCAERTIHLYHAKLVANAAAAKARSESLSASQSTSDLSTAQGSTVGGTLKITSAVALPARTQAYNYSALLQRVIMALQEANRKVKSADSLHDFATLLDRGKRQKGLDPAAVASLFDCLRLVVRGCASAEEKSFKALEDAYWLLRGGKPEPRRVSSSFSKLLASPKPKVKEPKQPKAAKAKAPRKSHGASQDSDEDTDDGLSDTDLPKSSRSSSGGTKRARTSTGGARKRPRAESSDSDSSDESDNPIAQSVLEPLLDEALDLLRSYDHNAVFQEEVTDAIAPGYSAKVKNPMDMIKMQRKLDAHEYHSLKEFDRDVDLMVRNCERYHGKASEYTKLGNALRRQWTRKYTDIKDSRSGVALPEAPAPKPKKANPKPSVPKVKAVAPVPVSAGAARPHSAAVTAGLAKILKEMHSLDPDTPSELLLKKVLELGWQYMDLADEKKIFAQPVSDKIAPGYSKVIKNKMALSNMKTKIYRSDYSSLEDFQEDIQLISDNCRKFNVDFEMFVQQALDFLSAWQTYYKAAATAWPAVTAAVLIGEDDEASEGSDTEDAPAVSADSAPKEIVLKRMAGVNVKVPPPDLGRYLDGAYIELPSIITAEQVRDMVGKKDPHSQQVQRTIISAGWAYLTELDVEGLFGTPVMTVDYLKTISSPMDLGTIKLKIDRRKYKTVAEFDQDVTLMLHNCFHYNEEGAWVAMYAEQMQFGWYLCKKNIESVVTGNPALAVELKAPHLEGTAADYEEPEPAPVPAATIAPVVKALPSPPPAPTTAAATKKSIKAAPEPEPVVKAEPALTLSPKKEEVHPVAEVVKPRIAKKRVILDEDEWEGEAEVVVKKDSSVKPAVEVEQEVQEEKPQTSPVADVMVKVEVPVLAEPAKSEQMETEMEMDVVEEVKPEEVREEAVTTKEEAPEKELVKEMEKEDGEMTEDTPATLSSVQVTIPAPAPTTELAPSTPMEVAVEVVVEDAETANVPVDPVKVESSHEKKFPPETTLRSSTPQSSSCAASPLPNSQLTLKLSEGPSAVVSQSPVFLATPAPSSRAASVSSITANVPEPQPVRAQVQEPVAVRAVRPPTPEAAPREDQPPAPSVLLRSLKAAVEAFNTPRRLMNGRVVGGTGEGLYLNELPAVIADAQLSWALTLLKDFSVQALLRKQFAMRLRDLITASADTSGITQVKADEMQHKGHFASKVLFPHADVQCRQLFQLCQMSFTYANHVDRIDEHVLRVYIPLLIYFVVRPSGEAPKVVPDNERAQQLTVTARAVVKSVLEHPVHEKDNIFARQSYTTCFSDKAVLRDFLEATAKHLVNMKLKG